MRLLHLAILVSFGMKLRRSIRNQEFAHHNQLMVFLVIMVLQRFGHLSSRVFSPARILLPCNEFYAEVSHCISSSVLTDVTVSSATVVVLVTLSIISLMGLL